MFSKWNLQKSIEISHFYSQNLITIYIIIESKKKFDHMQNENGIVSSTEYELNVARLLLILSMEK